MGLLAIYLLPAAAAFLGFILIQMKDGKLNAAQKMASILNLVVAASLFFYAQYYNTNFLYSIWVDLGLKITVSFAAPVFFLFLKTLTDYRGLRARHFIPFIPSIIYAILLTAVVLCMTEPEQIYYMGHVIQGESGEMETSLPFKIMDFLGHRFFKAVILLQIVSVLVYAIFEIRKYYALLDDVYTTREGKETNKTLLFIGLCLAAIIYALAIFTVPHYSFIPTWRILLYIIIVCLFIGIVSYLLSGIRYTAENLKSLLDSETVHNGSEPDEDEGSLAARLTNAMTEHELWKNPELTIISLSEFLGTNRTYVSKAIKSNFNGNFSDFVNRYRIEHAVKLMKSQRKEDVVLKSIAVDSGYGSLSSFTRNFKILYHATPSQWLENQ